jgi:5-methylcytosine-specific restriction endonuclease McrA
VTKSRKLERVDKQYSIDIIHDITSTHENDDLCEIDGHKFKPKSIRYQNFRNNGTDCVMCGVTGSHYYLERNSRDSTWHFNLYAINEHGHEILMTKDHVIAKSRDGVDHVNNMQPMCCKCNMKKGSFGDSTYKFIVNNKLDHLYVKAGRSVYLTEKLNELLKIPIGFDGGKKQLMRHKPGKGWEYKYFDGVFELHNGKPNWKLSYGLYVKLLDECNLEKLYGTNI